MDERTAWHARTINSQLPNVTESLSRRLIAFFQVDPRKAHVESRIVPDATINAYATAKPSSALGVKLYSIGIHTGLVDALCRSAVQITHDPQARAEIMDRDGQLSAEYLDTFTSQVILSAYAFVLFHEFSHIMLGHLDWVSANMGMDALLEVSGEGGLDPITSQAFEFQADAFSLGPAFKMGVLNPGYVGFACTITFYLISHANDSIAGRKNSTHPHPVCRWANLVRWLVLPNMYTEREAAGWKSGYANARACMRKTGVRDLFGDLPQGASEEQVAHVLAEEVETIHRRAGEIIRELRPVHNLFSPR